MNVLRNMAIKHKLIFIIMLVCITGLVFAGATLIGWEYNTFRNNMVKNLSTQAEMISENCKASLAFEDAEDAKETLRALRVEPSIVYGCVYTKDGTLFATYYRDYADLKIQPSVNKNSGYGFSNGYLTVYKPIVLDGEIIGTTCLRSDMSPMYAMLKRNMSIIISVLFLSSLAAFLMSSRLQKVISGPILSLAKVAKAVSEENNYATRALKHSNDEVGLLIDAFNDMLEQIQQRDIELVDAKEKLEVRVEERTLELTTANKQLTQEINDRKKAEQSLIDLNERLIQSNQQLQEFTHVASHDLKEPTRKVYSFGRLLFDSLADKLNDDDLENLNFMIEGAGRMQQMVDAILTYSRITTKGIEFVPLDLNKIIEHVKALELSISIEETNAVISVPEPLLPVKGDPNQIRQLLQNLISNAIKYHKPDSLPEVTIRARKEDKGMVRIEVQDNGIGVKKEQCEKIFVMFRRMHSRSEYEGTGIGLAICKRIIERHGGDIGVESTYGEGSTIWFTLPASDTVQQQQNEPELVLANSESNNNSKINRV